MVSFAIISYDSVENGDVNLLYMPTEDMAADVFTNG
jgi:hypothetical protein